MVISRVLNFAQKHPLVTSSAVISCRYLIGDALTQKYLESKPEINSNRLLCFAAFGAFGGAGPYYLFYNVIYSKQIFRRLGPLSVAFFDCGIAMPTWYFASFYTFRECFIEFEKHDDLVSMLRTAKYRYLEDYWDNTKMCFTIPFVQCVLMAKFVPTYLRASFIGVSGLAWVILLSFFRGNPKETVPIIVESNSDSLVN